LFSSSTERKIQRKIQREIEISMVEHAVARYTRSMDEGWGRFLCVQITAEPRRKPKFATMTFEEI